MLNLASRPEGRKTRTALALVLIVISLVPLWPNWLDSSLPSSHEGYRYSILGDMFADALWAGVPYPRWLPDMNGGFGYPEFVFYQPGYFFVHALFAPFTEDFFLRQLLTLSTIAVLGGCGMYLLARPLAGRWRSLALVAAFELAPYVYINLYIRGDLSEWMALQLMPWPALFLHRLVHSSFQEDDSRRMYPWFALVLTTSVVCYCHPVAVIFLPLLLMGLGTSMFIQHALQKKMGFPVRGIVELAGAIGLGMVLSSPYWLGVSVMKPFVNADVASHGFFEASQNVALLDRMLWGSLLDHEASFNESEFLGLPFAAFALLGAWLGRQIPLIGAAGLTYLAITLAMTAVGGPIWDLYPFSLLQFPWRLASFAPLLQAICLIGFCVPSFLVTNHPRLGQSILTAIVGVCMIWSIHGHFKFHVIDFGDITCPDCLISTRPWRLEIRHAMSGGTVNQARVMACLREFAVFGRPSSYLTTIDAGEWMPATAVGSPPPVARALPLDSKTDCLNLQPRLNRFVPALFKKVDFSQAMNQDWVTVSTPTWTSSPLPDGSPFHFRYRLGGSMSTDVIINQIYLPGWRIVLDGKQVLRAELENLLLEDGRMRIRLVAGEHHLDAYYDGPLYWRERNVAILAAVLLAFAYWQVRRRRKVGRLVKYCCQQVKS